MSEQREVVGYVVDRETMEKLTQLVAQLPVGQARDLYDKVVNAQPMYDGDTIQPPKGRK